MSLLICPARPGFLHSEWVTLDSGAFGAQDFERNGMQGSSNCSSRPKACKVYERVIRELARLPGPVWFLDSSSTTVDSGPVTAEDIA